MDHKLWSSAGWIPMYVWGLNSKLLQSYNLFFCLRPKVETFENLIKFEQLKFKQLKSRHLKLNNFNFENSSAEN